jgi:hypothetical protein
MKIKLENVSPDLRRRIEQQIKNEDRISSPLPNPVAERHQAPALGPTVQRKTKGDDRIKVRFVGCRVRPLDPDNFAGSVKDLLDGLRHAGLISGDEPWKIILETEQVKVDHFSEELTFITIYYDPTRTSETVP